MFDNLFQGSVSGEEGDAQSQQAMAGRVGAQLEVVDDSPDGLDAGAARLPLVEAAELAALHHVHAASVVGLLVQHPPGHKGRLTWVPALCSCKVPTLRGCIQALAIHQG